MNVHIARARAFLAVSAMVGALASWVVGLRLEWLGLTSAAVLAASVRNVFGLVFATEIVCLAQIEKAVKTRGGDRIFYAFFALLFVWGFFSLWSNPTEAGAYGFMAAACLPFLAVREGIGFVKRRWLLRTEPRALIGVPGQRIDGFFRWFLPTRYYEAYFAPLWGEFFAEWACAIQAGDLKRAKRIRVFYVMVYVWTCVGLVWGKIRELMRGVAK